MLALFALGVLSARAQVLARPGWAGSGVAPEAWWLRAVFYRVDPTRFQDSDGDGRGDLGGVEQRLDYLQSLGVDALLLDGPLPDEALNDLIREASRRHLRVLTTIRPTPDAGSRDRVLKATRLSLSAGAAGAWVPKPPAGSTASLDYPSLLASLRAMVQSFPGERVLLTDPAPVSSTAPAAVVRSSRHSIDPGTFGAARGGVLVTSVPLATDGSNPELRDSLLAASQPPGPGLNPLLHLGEPPAPGSGQALADAVLLLGGRGAIVLNFGQEIGLNTFPPTATGSLPSSLPVMQWTPSNRTPAPIEPPEPASSPSSPPAGEFGAYHPYIRPPRDFTPHGSSPTRVIPDANLPASLPDPDTLPGFTTASLIAAPVDGARLNVATEDRDPSSLLNTYRQLIALHHGNATLRNGEFHLLGKGEESTVAWLRRAPATARTAANIIGVVNLSDQSVIVPLAGELESLGLRAGPVRILFASPAGELAGETANHLTLPPHAVLLGELSGTRADPARRSAAHSHHRVSR